MTPPTPPGPRLLLQGGRGDTFTRFFKAFPAAAAGGVKRVVPGVIFKAITMLGRSNTNSLWTAVVAARAGINDGADVIWTSLNTSFGRHEMIYSTSFMSL